MQPYTVVCSVTDFYRSRQSLIVLRLVFATLSAATALATAGFISQVFSGEVHAKQYPAVLSALICGIAAYHYSEIIKVRTSAVAATPQSEFEIDVLRYSDWAITLPLLTTHLHSMVDSSDHQLIWGSVGYSAVAAFVVIALGAFVRLGLGDLKQIEDEEQVVRLRIVAAVCFFVSCLILLVLLIDLFIIFGNAKASFTVFSFFGIWPLYGVVASIPLFYTSKQGFAQGDATLRDVCFGLLDVYAKGFLTFHTILPIYGQVFL